MGTSNNGRPIQANDKVMDDKGNNKISLDFMTAATISTIGQNKVVSCYPPSLLYGYGFV